MRSLKREDLVRWHRRVVCPVAMIISIVGNLEEQDVIDMVTAALHEWVHDGFGGKDPGQLAGRTENNRVVNFRCDQPALIGKFADILIEEALPNSLRGTLIDSELG